MFRPATYRANKQIHTSQKMDSTPHFPEKRKIITCNLTGKALGPLQSAESGQFNRQIVLSFKNRSYFPCWIKIYAPADFHVLQKVKVVYNTAKTKITTIATPLNKKSQWQMKMLQTYTLTWIKWHNSKKTNVWISGCFLPFAISTKNKRHRNAGNLKVEGCVCVLK